MNFNEAKEFFKQKYINLQFELVDEHTDELFFKYKDYRFSISKEEIEEYIKSYNYNSELENRPAECSICGKNYREQLVYSTIIFRSFISPIIFGDITRDQPYVHIGPPSINYQNYFRFNEYIIERWRDRLRFANSYDIKEHFGRFVTIKVFNINGRTVDESIKLSNNIIYTCFFDLSYINKVPLVLIENFYRKPPYRLGKEFIHDRRERRKEFSFPSVFYNSDLVKLYQHGVSTNLPNLQFLMFYQILEYYFGKVSDELLYNRIFSVLNDPKFQRNNPKDVDLLIETTKEHKDTKDDETKLLSNVIKKFVRESDIKQFMQDYEKYIKEELYKQNRDLFGVNVITPASQTGDSFYSTLAKTIKTTRNALVHAYDRYERVSKYIPTPENDAIVKKEIPLVKFLAEKVIIAASSKSIDIFS